MMKGGLGGLKARDRCLAPERREGGLVVIG